MAINVGSVRRSQLITTYGVGAIVATGDESVMIAGIDKWPVGKPDLHEPRLERKLGVYGFVLPPASGDDRRRDIPVVRFPTIHSCPTCHRLDSYRYLAQPSQFKCNLCGVRLIPSRFVVVCPNGHIDDFPYFAWVHAGTKQSEERNHVLTIESSGASAALGGILIRCSCGKSSSMQGAFGKNALKGICSCLGRRPWLEDREECLEAPGTLRTMQRGASNVHFAIWQSALSIPPWSEGAFKIINRHWAVLKSIPDVALEATLTAMNLANGTPYSTRDLVAAVLQRKSGENSVGSQSEPLKPREYEALLRGRDETSRDQDFVCVPSAGAQNDLGDWFDKVMLAKRLREVRALQAFKRLFPPSPGDNEKLRAPLSRTPLDWLPAIEVLGEGVFLQLKAKRLNEWEGRKNVLKRAERINRNYKAKFAALGAAADRPITPRLILIHTLAHALINQWSLECGYPAASLRERLFVSEPDAAFQMAGLLIYTATTDAAGSLGGVVAQAEAGRLGTTLREAINRASWCSSDPLCVEGDATGVDSLNLAACHACVLLPEVSCEEANCLLDRALLVGLPNDSSVAFFEELVDK
jgi:uncharacterized protein DUF1998